MTYPCIQTNKIVLHVIICFWIDIIHVVTVETDKKNVISIEENLDESVIPFTCAGCIHMADRQRYCVHPAATDNWEIDQNN